MPNKILTPSEILSALGDPRLRHHLSASDAAKLRQLQALADPQTGGIPNDAALHALYPGHEHKAATDALGKLRTRLKAAAEAAGVTLSLTVQGAKKAGAAHRMLHFTGQPSLAEPPMQALALVGTRMTHGQRATLGTEPVVLLVTVNHHETQALFDRFLGQGHAPETSAGYSLLGVHGGFRVVHTLCEMGSAGPGAALQRTGQAIRQWRPAVVIGVGIGFGCQPGKQAFGEVLVSRQIQCYEGSRCNSDGSVTLRGDRVTASEEWLRHLRTADAARQRDSRPHWPRLHFGLLLSGEKLIDHLAFRDALVAKTEGQAIGGEMEAAGIYTAASGEKTDWVIVKAISDWADGHKSGHTPEQKAEAEQQQRRAADNAAAVVYATLTGRPLPGDPPTNASHPTGRRQPGAAHLPEPAYDSADAIGPRLVKDNRGRPGALSKTSPAEGAADASVDAFKHLLAWAHRADGASLFALLGEYGMGKTVTCQRLAMELNRLCRESGSGATPQALYFDLRDLTNLHAGGVPTLNAILQECIVRRWRGPGGEPTITPAQVHELIRNDGALVIFDGLDEVLVHYDTAPGQAFTRELLSLLPHATAAASARGKLLVSCRTHFFRSLREQTTHFTGEDRSDKTAAHFEAMTLLPFTEEQVRQYLQHALPDADVQKLVELIQSVHNLPELAERPYTLSLIADHIPALEQRRAAGETIHGVTLYREMVQSWLERDSGKHHLKPEHKLQLAAHLAASLWRQGQRLITAPLLEQWFGDWLAAEPAIARRYTHITPDKLEEDLRNSTFLVREDGSQDTPSGFRFAHSSMQEFFLAQYLLAALRAGRPQDWAIQPPSRETLDFLGQLLAEAAPNEPGLIATLAGWRAPYRAQASELLLAYGLHAARTGWPLPTLAGGDWRGADLAGWEFGEAPSAPPSTRLDLSDAQFQQATLRNAVFHHVALGGAQFDGADLRWAEWHSCWLRGASFAAALADGVVLRECDLAQATFNGAQGHGLQCLRCRPADELPRLPAEALIAPPPANVQRDIAAVESAQLHWLTGHAEGTTACAFSPDGAWLASSSHDGTLRLWDVRSGLPLRSFSGHEGTVTSCTFSPDGTWLASASHDGTLCLWNAHSGQPLRRFSGHSGPVISCAFSPDGAWLASSSLDRTLRLWNAHSGQTLRTFSGHTRSVTCCAFSPLDGAWLASSSPDGTLRIWDPHTGQTLRSFCGDTGTVISCAFSPDGAWLASTGSDGSLRLWDPRSGELLRTFSGHKEPATSCAFSPDGAWLASTSRDGTLRLWDARSGQPLRNFCGHTGAVTSCAFSPDGAWLVSSSLDCTVRLWNAHSGQPLRRFSGHSGSITCCALSPDGARLAFSSLGNTLRLIDARSKQPLRSFAGHEDWITSCVFSPDGSRLASTSQDGTLRLWDADSGQTLHSFSGHKARVTSCSFSPDGGWLASTGIDGTLRLWDTRSGLALRNYIGHNGKVSCCAFSPDGTWLASAGEDGSLLLWVVRYGHVMRNFIGDAHKVAACAFSPDGAWLASASDGGLMCLWDIRSGHALRSFSGHERGVTSCTFSPEGALLASASKDATLRLWDIRSGQLLRTITCAAPVTYCAFSPDGAELVSANADGTLRYWDAQSGKPLSITAFAEPGQAVWIPTDQRIIEASGDAWRHLAWVGQGPSGEPMRWPLESFGRVPEPATLASATWRD